MIDIFVGRKQYVQREGILEEAGELFKPFGRRPLVLGDDLVLSIVRPILEDRNWPRPALPLLRSFWRRMQPEGNRPPGGDRPGPKPGFYRRRGRGQGPGHLPTRSQPAESAAHHHSDQRRDLFGGLGRGRGLRKRRPAGDGQRERRGPGPGGFGDPGKAPLRLLAAGMGDALAKWYEGKPCYDQLKERDSASQSAMTLSTQVKETLLRVGLRARNDVEAKRNSPAVERIVENNILLTAIIGGLGGSKFRIAVAHALLYGLTVLPQVHQNLHGEMVSYGILVQLCLEKNEKELKRSSPLLLPTGAAHHPERPGTLEPGRPPLLGGVEANLRQGKLRS